MRELLEGALSTIIVAPGAEHLCGFVAARIQETAPLPIVIPGVIGIVDDIVVDRRYRRRGVGSALMNAAREWCICANTRSIEVFVHDFNLDAAAFYKKLGFRTVIRRMSLALNSSDPPS